MSSNNQNAQMYQDNQTNEENLIQQQQFNLLKEYCKTFSTQAYQNVKTIYTQKQQEPEYKEILKYNPQKTSKQNLCEDMGVPHTTIRSTSQTKLLTIGQKSS
jgi:hypothetical protein